jgi:hypothetical protein
MVEKSGSLVTPAKRYCRLSGSGLLDDDAQVLATSKANLLAPGRTRERSGRAVCVLDLPVQPSDGTQAPGEEAVG